MKTINKGTKAMLIQSMDIYKMLEEKGYNYDDKEFKTYAKRLDVTPRRLEKLQKIGEVVATSGTNKLDEIDWATVENIFVMGLKDVLKYLEETDILTRKSIRLFKKALKEPVIEVEETIVVEKVEEDIEPVVEVEQEVDTKVEEVAEKPVVDELEATDDIELDKDRKYTRMREMYLTSKKYVDLMYKNVSDFVEFKGLCGNVIDTEKSIDKIVDYVKNFRPNIVEKLELMDALAWIYYDNAEDSVEVDIAVVAEKFGTDEDTIKNYIEVGYTYGNCKDADEDIEEYKIFKNMKNDVLNKMLKMNCEMLEKYLNDVFEEKVYEDITIENLDETIKVEKMMENDMNDIIEQNVKFEDLDEDLKEVAKDIKKNSKLRKTFDQKLFNKMMGFDRKPRFKSLKECLASHDSK